MNAPADPSAASEEALARILRLQRSAFSVERYPDFIAAVNAHSPDSIVHTAAIGYPAVVAKDELLALRVKV